jgi:hypothetical protein
MRKPLQQPEPCVGIFWLIDSKIIIDTTALSEAGKYGDFKIHDGDHVTHWAEMEKRGEVPRGSEYEELPRGRVNFDTRTQQFTLRADACILRETSVVKELLRLMHLPVDSVLSSDKHYRCSRCLAKRHRNLTEDD